MPKPISMQKATRELEAAVAGKPQQLWKSWPALPDGLPLTLVGPAMKRIVASNHDVGVIGRALPPAYIDTFLEVLAQKPAWPLVVAARSVVNVEGSRRSVVLGRVLKTIKQLGVFSASRSQLEARVRVFVKDEPVVEAARQIVLHATFDELRDFHRLMLVSLLMEDASEASMDALIAEAHAATKSPERIDALRECLRWRKQPSARLEPLRALLDARTAESVGTAIASLVKQVGLARAPSRLRASFHGQAGTKRGELSVDVHFDSEASVWWDLRAGVGMPPKHFVSAAPGVCEHEWPGVPALASPLDYREWLAAVFRAAGVKRFERSQLMRSSVRGEDRMRLLAWLSGA